MPRYQWPASRLDEEEMALLFQARQKTKESVCELLRKSVHVAYGNLDYDSDNLNASGEE